MDASELPRPPTDHLGWAPIISVVGHVPLRSYLGPDLTNPIEEGDGDMVGSRADDEHPAIHFH